MADNVSSSSSSKDLPHSSQTTTERGGHTPHDKLERRSSKSRLLKQEVVEVAEESDLPVWQERVSLPPNFRVPDDVPEAESAVPAPECKPEEDEDHSPNSDSSDQTVVPVESLATSSSATPHGSPKGDNSSDDGSSSQDARRNADADKSSPTQALNPKVKLVRSQAVYDDASPPPPPEILLIRSAAAAAAADSSPSDLRDVRNKDCVSPISYSGCTATLSVSPTFQMRGFGRQRLGQDSSQGSTVSDTSPVLSRDSSFETSYTDSTGTNLEEFIIKTLNKKQSDRTMLLHLEADMIAFIKDTSQEKHRFPQMSSYHRMLVHRTAAFFGLDHNVDETGKSVIINRLECTRIPDFKFRDHIRDDLPQDDPPKKFILKRHRDCTSLEETRGTDRVTIDDRMSKSFEERQEEYHEARNRIFQQRELLQEIGGHPVVNRPSNLCGSHESSKDDIRWHPDLRPWSSTDSSGYSTDSSSRLKVYVTKASSFHSVTVLTRGDSRTSTGSGASRFSKTDSLSSGISNLGSPIVIPPTIPSSPPLEDQEFESGSSDTSAVSPSQQKSLSVEAPNPGSPFLSFTDETGEPLAIWVASTIDQIPPGSIIINPQTGEPYFNPDGTVYRWYPSSDCGAMEVERLPRTEEPSSDITSTALEGCTVDMQQGVDTCEVLHHQFLTLSMKPADSLPVRKSASPSSISSYQLPQQVYLVTPGNPTPPAPAGSHPQRAALQHPYHAPLQPVARKLPPFYATSVPGGHTAVRFVCQVPQQPAGYQMVGSEGHEMQELSHAHFGYLPQSYSSDVCQMMAFPQQMTIHSVETYPPGPPPPEHGCVPQVVPCIYVPQYASDHAETPRKIFYMPASSSSAAFSAVEGLSSQSLSGQGQFQVIRVNAAAAAASNPRGLGHAFYSSPPGNATAGGPLPRGGGGTVPQYVCYAYPPESSHSCSASVPMAPAPIIQPTGLTYPGALSQARSSASPNSPPQQLPSGASQFKTYLGNTAPRASHFPEPGVEYSGEPSGNFLLRQHLPSPRLMPVRQPQVVFSSRGPAPFPLGDPRLPVPNVPPPFANIVRPRTRVPDVSLYESTDSLSAYQAASGIVREAGSRDSTPKSQQRLG